MNLSKLQIKPAYLHMILYVPHIHNSETFI